MIELRRGEIEVVQPVDDQDRHQCRRSRPTSRRAIIQIRAKAAMTVNLGQGRNRRSRRRSLPGRPPPSTKAAAAACRSRVAIRAHTSGPRSRRAGGWDRAATAEPSRAPRERPRTAQMPPPAALRSEQQRAPVSGPGGAEDNEPSAIQKHCGMAAATSMQGTFGCLSLKHDCVRDRACGRLRKFEGELIPGSLR